MHIPKKGLRALGIAESFSGRTHSTLSGVVMRKDLRIDGFVFGTVEVGGMDATDTILQMVEALHRSDINVIMLSGCVIAWFNIIDPLAVFNKTGIPVIGITYEASEGLLSDIRFHFPDDTIRLAAYENLGERTQVLLHISQSDALRLCDDFTLEGKIPEPLRVARICARSFLQKSGNKHIPDCHDL